MAMVRKQLYIIPRHTPAARPGSPISSQVAHTT
jgi:hypothetical protein